MIRLSSASEIVESVARSREVGVLAYTLRRGAVLAALEKAAERGAHVCVRLEGAPYGATAGALARYNRRIAAELTRCGAEVQLAQATTAASDAPVHAKALVAGECVYLDDRNFGDGDFIVADGDARDARNTWAAIDGCAPADSTDAAFAIHKRAALAREAALLRATQPGVDVIVESESFGYSNPVYSALDALAKNGRTPRLLVSSREARNAREAKALAHLAVDGVAIRLTRSTEKFALAGDRAWIGSANASPAFGDPDMLDWGLCTSDRATVAAARERVEARWRDGARLTDFYRETAAVIERAAGWQDKISDTDVQGAGVGVGLTVTPNCGNGTDPY